MNREEIEREIQILREIKRREAMNSFWSYLKAINPSFYRDDRPYLKKIADVMEGVYFGKIINDKTGKPYKKLALSVPPSHGKSYIASMFSQFVLAKHIEAQVITISYNEKMSAKFGQLVRDGIMAEGTGNPSEFVFSDIFPDTKIKYGDASKYNWSLEDRYNSYLATSFTATLTGFRGSLIIIDDPIPNVEAAFNANYLEGVWSSYKDTVRSRVLEGGTQIIIQTRWSKEDLIGRVLELDGDGWYELNLPAYDEEKDEMLCEEILSKETYEENLKYASTSDNSMLIFLANYQQKLIDSKNKLYTNLVQYSEAPREVKETICLVDPADTGKDSLVAIVADISKTDNKAYIKDVLMTKKDMDETGPALAKMLTKHKVRRVKIESNSAGRLFGSNVEKELKKLGNNYTHVELFHQKKNKEARIFSHAHVVENEIRFPENWRYQYPEYYLEMNSYKRTGRNAHDDANDCTTMLAEELTGKKGSNQGLTANMLGI